MARDLILRATKSRIGNFSDSQAKAKTLETLEQRVVLAAPFAFDPNNTIVELQTTMGSIRIELFDTIAPGTVQNFLTLVQNDRYDRSFFHRHATNFVIQGGGYSYTAEDGLGDVVHNGKIQNEYGRSNLARTLAMAKQDGDPNSATSQFFFNLSDNSSNLNNQNGGFTVFAQVYDDDSWAVVQAIAGLQIVNFGNPFTTTPVTENFDPQAGAVDESWFVYINDAVVIHTPQGVLTSLLNAVPNVSAGPNGTAVVAVLNEFGQTTIYQRLSGSSQWVAVDPDRDQTLPTPSKNLVTWRDPKDSRFYAAVPTSGGLLLYTNTAAGVWTTRNLTSEISGAGIIDSEITQWKTNATRNNVFRIVGVMANGDVVQYEQTVTVLSGGGYRWNFKNLSDDLRAINATTPDFQGRLIAYSTAWDAWHIAGLDSAGQIQTIWRGPRMSQWVLSNLSTITGAPALSGGLSVYLTPWKGINLAGVDSSGNLQITWWIPRFEGTWVVSNLTSSISAPAVFGESITSFNTPSGGLNIAARTTDNDVVVFWWVPGAPGNLWRVQNVTTIVSTSTTPLALSGELSATASGDGITSIVGRGPGGKVVRYFGSVTGQTWSMEDLSSIATVV
ncbi:MAG: peptidylprolyl isomerase [Phycisphaeraceae bacterium]|nr:peptidylprolyl isomerase [Phycisphaeraceae bacterium]QYK49526.1 MAG: peptidylprolyl isomerase [Phycisphaeraceae bacterium]